MESCLSSSVIPQRGPLLFIVPGISYVPIAPATISPPLTAEMITFQWPIRCKVVAINLLPLSGLPADLAKLQLEIFDETGDLITDGQQVPNQSPFLPMLQLAGIAPSVFHLTGWTWSPQAKRFTRCVRAGERWKFRIQNTDGARTITPVLGFEYETLLTTDPGILVAKPLFGALK